METAEEWKTRGKGLFHNTKKKNKNQPVKPSRLIGCRPCRFKYSTKTIESWREKSSFWTKGVISSTKKMTRMAWKNNEIVARFLVSLVILYTNKWSVKNTIFHSSIQGKIVVKSVRTLQMQAKKRREREAPWILWQPLKKKDSQADKFAPQPQYLWNSTLKWHLLLLLNRIIARQEKKIAKLEAFSVPDFLAIRVNRSILTFGYLYGLKLK